MKKQKSFTIIELLVVFAIIGLLASIILVATRGVREKARYAKILQYSASVKHVLGAYILGEWSFEDNVYDTSGNENHGTNNGVSFEPNDASTQLGKAGKFNRDSYISIPHSSSLNIGTGSMTLSAWVNPAVIPNNVELLNHSANDRIHFYFNNGKIYRWGSQGISSFTGPTIPANKWSLITYVANMTNDTIGTETFYLNGALDTTRTGNVPNVNSTGPWAIGARSDGVLWRFNGLIDEVRIYKQALTSAQIKKLYVEGAEKRGLAMEE